MNGTYLMELHRTKEILENPDAAGDAAPNLLDFWMDLLQTEERTDILEPLKKFQKTLDSGSPEKIGQALVDLGQLVFNASKQVDDSSVADHLTQLASVLTKTGNQHV